MSAVMYSTAKPGKRPTVVKCHASPVCPANAIGWVKPKGGGRMWIPTCERHVGPWTIQGSDYRGPSQTREHGHR
jgi:hypothetical protein